MHQTSQTTLCCFICPLSSSTFFFVFPADRCSLVHCCLPASKQKQQGARSLRTSKRWPRLFPYRVAEWDPITGGHWRRMWKCMLMPGGHTRWELSTRDRVLQVETEPNILSHPLDFPNNNTRHRHIKILWCTPLGLAVTRDDLLFCG